MAQPKELYGGAMVANVPPDFMDARYVWYQATVHTSANTASDMRQVPDNQEVFLDGNGADSIIFDVCERVRSPTDVDALKYHAEDIIEGINPSITCISTLNIPHLP